MYIITQWCLTILLVFSALTEFWLFTLVDETESDSGVTCTEKNKQQGENPLKILVAYFSW